LVHVPWPEHVGPPGQVTEQSAQHGWRGEGGGKRSSNSGAPGGAGRVRSNRRRSVGPARLAQVRGPRAATPRRQWGWRGREPARPMYARPGRAPREAREWRQNGGWQRQGGWGATSAGRSIARTTGRAEHRPWAKRGGYGGTTFPADASSGASGLAIHSASTAGRSSITVGRRATRPLTVILERDGAYPPMPVLLDELAHARAAVARGREARS
jgi:hypothetical protein